jgi:hypothetical protein
MALKIFKGDGFKLSMSGSARQVVLLSHGGWTAVLFKGPGKIVGDSYTFVPESTMLHFYTEHGSATKGSSAAMAILKDQSGAFPGLKEQVADPRFKAFSIQCTESKGGAGKVQIYNYALSIDDRPAATSLWDNHCKGQFGSDVDLLMLDTKKDKHLKDAYAFCFKALNRYYSVMHYCPCRWIEETDTVSMTSVRK